MKLISPAKHVFAILLLSAAITGCASSGGQQSGFSDTVNNVGGALKGVGSAVGGMFQPYRNGVHVSDERLAELSTGMSVSEVEMLIGPPPEINDSHSGEIWSYPYSEISHFGANINETTVVRFDTSGKLVKAYKTNSRTSASGNPLLDAANGVN